jgi:hypothetical protein
MAALQVWLNDKPVSGNLAIGQKGENLLRVLSPMTGTLVISTRRNTKSRLIKAKKPKTVRVHLSTDGPLGIGVVKRLRCDFQVKLTPRHPAHEPDVGGGG